jgi:hypothetical protein
MEIAIYLIAICADSVSGRGIFAKNSDVDQCGIVGGCVSS